MKKVIEVKNISKVYYSDEGIVNAIDDVSFDVFEGEIVAIVGSSGCGKSTLLSILGNLDNSTSGNIKIDNNNRVGYMLQSDALLPWLSIIDNVLLPLKINNLYDEVHIKYVEDLLLQYGLSEFKDKKPSSLSGGMKQRVALIRTLSLRPSILLLDEPFSALDYQTRMLISNDIYTFSKNNIITVVLVTHDLAEAISMADRVIVLSKRPCVVNKIIDINLTDKGSVFDNRKSPEFNRYYNEIWRCIDASI